MICGRTMLGLHLSAECHSVAINGKAGMVKRLAGGFVGCVTSPALAIMLQARIPDREHFDALSLGMTRKEVERVLGGPARNESSGHATVWVRRADGRLISAFLSAGPPEASFFPALGEGEQELVWVSEVGLIAVRFGVDGRLQDSYFSAVHDPGGPTGPLRWISRESKFTPKP